MNLGRVFLPLLAQLAAISVAGTLLIRALDPSGPVKGMLFVILVAVAGLLGGFAADKIPEHRT